MTQTPGPTGPQEGDGPSGSPHPTAESEIERVKEPAKLLRVSAMTRSLLEEARGLPLDEHAREQLGRIHARAVEEIAESVAPELRDELERLLPTPTGPLSQTEIRIVHGQLVGWLEGIFQGIRTGLTLQQAGYGPDLPVPAAPPRPTSGGDTGPYL
ncbi:proteasome activator [Nonomuraea sp. NPDC050643]|uniref:proteasome activator n=1 Tax=Nonomuraea sp. NPDC050643 TaxID=3155660 RepID=UPI0033DF4F9E